MGSSGTGNQAAFDDLIQVAWGCHPRMPPGSCISPRGHRPWEKRRKESEEMSIAITKHPIVIRAGQSDLSGVYAKPSSAPRALIVALHGGGNSAAIFDTTIPGEAGFLETAASLGYAALALDRPGYRASQQIASDLLTFEGQIALLRLALTAAWEQYGADSAGIVLLGQSFGGLIVLGLAASHPDVPLLGVSTHGTGLQWLPGALQGFQSLLSDAPSVQLPFDENARSRGPANS